MAAFPNFIAVVEGRVIGHAVLCPEGDSAEVAIFVHQDSRRHGLGKPLLNKLKNEGQRLGLRRLWGITEPNNVAMLRLAVSLGFVLSAEPGEFYIKFEQRTEAIRRRAYEIYLTRGGGPGREMEDWLQAEGEFFSVSPSDR
ncbi:MAG: GNAT family N-acetyltransferase [Acidobacteria bacterium]|nr:GNAT family N-acetyltransferase [Acidobacteriota bacterium]